MSTGGGQGLRGKDGAGSPPAWEGDPTLPRCQGEVHPGPLLGKAGASQGLGRQARPSEFWSPQRPATLRMTCPKSWHNSLARAGSAWGSRRAVLGQGRSPCRAVWARGEGRKGSRELDVRGSESRAWPPQGSFLPFPPGGRGRRPPRRPSTEHPEVATAASWPRGSCFWEGSCTPRGVCSPPSLKAERRPAWGWGLERSEGEPSTCSVQRPQPKPGPQQPSRPRHGSAHTLAHAQQSHTCTHPSPQT